MSKKWLKLCYGKCRIIKLDALRSMEGKFIYFV